MHLLPWLPSPVGISPRIRQRLMGSWSGPTLIPGRCWPPRSQGCPTCHWFRHHAEPHGVSPLTRQLRRGLRALGMPITHHYHRKIRYLAHGQNLRWATEGG